MSSILTLDFRRKVYEAEKLIQVKDLQVLYYGKPIYRTPISFTQFKGQNVHLLGSSGMGKTTLMKALLDNVEYEGSKKIFTKYSFLHVENHFDLTETVKDNFFNYYKMFQINYSAEQVQNYVELREPGTFNKVARDCSYGTLRRLALYRAILERNPLILLDQPTLGSDLRNVKKIKETLSKSSSNFFVISHDSWTPQVADLLVLLSEVWSILSVTERSGFVKLDLSDLDVLRRVLEDPASFVSVYLNRSESVVIYKLSNKTAYDELIFNLQKDGTKYQCCWKSEQDDLSGFLNLYFS